MSSNMKKWLSRIIPLAIAFAFCLGGAGLLTSDVFADDDPPASPKADLIVSYGETTVEFFFDKDQGQFFRMDGDTKQYVSNTDVGLYTAIKNSGVADNVTDAQGPAVLDILAKAGINYSGFDNQKITFIPSDGYDPPTFRWGELFCDRYAFPKANRPGSDPGDQGAAVTGEELEGKTPVPVILNFNLSQDEPQLSFGQISPSERNKPSFAKCMCGQGKDKDGKEYTATIKIEDVDSFEQMPNRTVDNVSVPKGSKVAVGDVIDFGGDKENSPYNVKKQPNGVVYYTTDGSDPNQESAIYNWDTYLKTKNGAQDYLQYNPFTVDSEGSVTIKTIEYCYGYEPSEIETFTYTAQKPDLIVTYKDTTANFFFDKDQGQFYRVVDGVDRYVDNTEVLLYTAIKNTGSADSVNNANGPKVLDILSAAGIDYSSFDKQKISFIPNDGYNPPTFRWGELFSERYAFPNAVRPGDPGDQGAPVTNAELEGKTPVPVILNFNLAEEEPQVSFGQLSPSERNKPSFAKCMCGQGKDKDGKEYTATIKIEDVESFESMPNDTDKYVSVPNGSKVAVGDVIQFGGEPETSPYTGTIYYTTDGSEPTQESAIYNWDTYLKTKGGAQDYLQYNPVTVGTKGDIVIKTVEYKYGYLPSKVKTFNYTTRTDLAKEGGKMTLSKTKVTAGAAKPTVKVVVGGKTLIANTHYTLSIGSTKKVGTVSAKVTGKGDYKGELTNSFKVIPAKAKIKTIKKGKKKATITIVSQKASGVTKYQIAYKLKTAKKWKTTTTKSTKKVIKKLKKGKKYNFKVRAYGATGYGAYSAVKTVKIK